ncbi:hypothetical protein [Sphingobacterium sp. DR205]|uniref:hypothetical protein n=1 Tax=Sphingobacterium sp. DR205 TaxID=2713573 RepID=UPI0011B269D2|nr:hypothetical protein [Sphingobacterium sp. DR205]QIH32251.1 hypothetical protein G6053_04745 [Sphingobacterium sp. DR205]
MLKVIKKRVLAQYKKSYHAKSYKKTEFWRNIKKTYRAKSYKNNSLFVRKRTTYCPFSNNPTCAKNKIKHSYTTHYTYGKRIDLALCIATPDTNPPD